MLNTKGFNQCEGVHKRTRPASFHWFVPPMPTGVSAMMELFLSTAAAGPSNPAIFTPLDGITCARTCPLRVVCSHYQCMYMAQR